MSGYQANLPFSSPLVIDGEEVLASTGRRFQREDPSDFRRIVTIAEEASHADVGRAVDSAREAFDGNRAGWASDYKLRERVLYRTAQLLRDALPQLVTAVSHEVGMPKRQALAHVSAAADVFEYYAGFASKLYGHNVFLPNGSLVNLVKEPVGVVGLITPWNFPLTQTARKLAPALAVGCTAVVKPASYTPMAGYYIVKILHQSGIPKGVVNLITGPGSSVGAAIVSNHGIDKVSFTGETEIGKGIMKEAANDLKRVSLELGGKNPFVVFEDAPIDAATRSLVFGMFRNAGQACGSTSRLLVQNSIHAEFTREVVGIAAKIRVGSPFEESTDMGPVISKSQEKKILEYVDNGKQAEYRLLLGGTKLETGEYRYGYYITPTIFDGVDPFSKLAQEEIFGPVLVVMPFKDEEEAVSIANCTPYGLTASVWAGDYPRALRISRRIKAGTVWINDSYTQPAEGIWGGYKQSGIGRELGPYGIEDFVEIKQIYTDGTGLSLKPHYRQVIRE